MKQLKQLQRKRRIFFETLTGFKSMTSDRPDTGAGWIQEHSRTSLIYTRQYYEESEIMCIWWE